MVKFVENISLLANSCRQKIDVEFDGLTFEVKRRRHSAKKTVIDNISGKFKSGELTAIMGPSGAGKSSLMNILTGLVKDGVTGSICFGNDLVKARKVCCYIMQDDNFYGFFTVEEVMMFTASLKISSQAMDLREKHLLIDGILNSLKLMNCKGTTCSHLSGGQRKRLSIALELIDNPAVLFLDEPTTGLDSTTSLDTIQLLQNLANEGRTVVCTIHQPGANIYSMFNQIYVLTRGICTYQGTPHKTVDFLKTVGLECPDFHNPADFLLECVNGDYGDYVKVLAIEAKNPEWCYANLEQRLNRINKDLDSDLDHTNLQNSTKHIYPPPEWIRLWLLISRCHIQIIRDWTVVPLKVLLHIICAITVSLTFGDSGSNANKQISNFGSMIIHCVYLWYTTSMPAILRFPEELGIIKKETFNNWYKLRTYYLATLITSTPIQIITVFIYITITYIMTDQLWELDRFVKFVLTNMVLTMCADGMGILLGTLLTPVNGVFVGSLVTCFMTIYSGFLIFLTDMSSLMRGISYLSPMRYSLENMVLAVYSNNRSNTICPPNVMYCHFKNAVTILKTLGMVNGNYGFNLLMLILNLVLFKFIAYWALKRKVKYLQQN